MTPVTQIPTDVGLSPDTAARMAAGISGTQPERQIWEHPLRANRLNTGSDYRPEWDVESANRAASDALIRSISSLKGQTQPDPGYKIPLMLSPPGYGKTHLFGRVASALRNEIAFAYVPAVEDATKPAAHIQWHVVESLFRTRGSEPNAISRILARLFQPSFAQYVEQFSPSLAARQQPLRQAIERGPEEILRICASVRIMAPFLRLAHSVGREMPDVPLHVLRALVLAWSPEAHIARRWLRGESLAEEDTEKLQLPDTPPSPIEVLRGITAIMPIEMPLVVSCDQCESLLKHPEGPRQFSAQVMELLHSVPRLALCISCMEESWAELTGRGFAGLVGRVDTPLKLKPQTDQEATELIRLRLKDFPLRPPTAPPLWPFDIGCITRFNRERQPNPRALLKVCADAFDEWLDKDMAGTICIDQKPAPVLDLPALFVQAWEAELAEVAADAERGAANLQEERLYRGVFETLTLAQESNRTMSGLRIKEIRTDVVRRVGSNLPKSMQVTLAQGGKDIKLVLAITKLEAATQFVWYQKAVVSAAEDCDGFIYITAKQSLPLGPAARKVFDEQYAAGRVRVLALEEESDAFEQMECLLSMLDKSSEGVLELAGNRIAQAECRRLVLASRRLDELDLFKVLSGWSDETETVAPVNETSTAETTASAAVPATSVEAGTASAVPGTVESGGTQVDSAEPASPSVELSVETQHTETSSNAVASPDTDAMLKLLVEKLKLWGQSVKPEGVEVGPTFMRFKVRPTGSRTSFRRIADKAEDLKIHLGLEFAPMISSQAHYVAVDIQRPDRQTVSLHQVLSTAPPQSKGRPVFPVGLDVAGKPHWVDLSEPSDCHLLVAGETGSGKSEFLRSTMAALASSLTPRQVRFVCIDPKRVTFNFGNRPSPYLYRPIAYDQESALAALQVCLAETKRRYDFLQKQNITDVSQLENRSLIPRIVVFVDEFASLLEDKETKKALTELMRQIGAIARAAGIHLVLATQRPDKDVIVPILRDNLPGRVALRVSSKGNSELILGSGSADAMFLLGRGDLLWKHAGGKVRLQSPFISTEQFATAMKLGEPSTP